MARGQKTNGSASKAAEAGISEARNGVNLGLEASGQGLSAAYLIRKARQEYLFRFARKQVGSISLEQES
jgi:hypothetical protein